MILLERTSTPTSKTLRFLEHERTKTSEGLDAEDHRSPICDIDPFVSSQLNIDDHLSLSDWRIGHVWDNRSQAG